MSEKDVINETAVPATVESLSKDLESLGLRAGQTVLVHSSLSRLGYVCGGAQTVIMALLDVLGSSGTLMMPTHSGQNTDPANWKAPPVPESWWPEMRTTSPAFNPLVTPSRGMGAIPEMFRNFPGVKRSSHPTTSFAAIGPNSDFLLGGGISLKEELSEDSPIGKLYEIHGQILLLGVSNKSNTSLHLAEYRAKLSNKTVVMEGTAMLVDGKRKWVEFNMLELDPDDFEQIGCAFINSEENSKFFFTLNVGSATCLLIQQRPLVDFAASWMEANR